MTDATTTPSTTAAATPATLAAAADALVRARSELATATAHLGDLPDTGARTVELARRAAAADAELLALEAELVTDGVELGVAAAPDAEQAAPHLEQLADLWRRRSEDLMVQARLGAMDLADARAAAVRDLERAGGELTGMIADLRADGTQWTADVRDRATAVVADVRSALTNVVDVVRT